MNKIPKIIHYCWFGNNEKPNDVIKYMETWKKNCPDYTIIEWNEKNFDITSNLYVKQAYEQKKYAFVADYVRLYVLYKYGGIYMDTDVEVLKPLDRFLENPAFSCFENNNYITTGIIGSVHSNPWIKDLLDEYKELKFIKDDGSLDLTTNVVRITALTINKYGLKLNDLYQNLNDFVIIYPNEFFSPKDWDTGLINCTENTYVIHHFAGSWHNLTEKKKAEKYKNKLNKYIDKYGKEKGTLKMRRKDNIKYYIFHPLKAINKIIIYFRGKKL